MKFDAFLIAKADAVAAWAQHRGVSLAAVRAALVLLWVASLWASNAAPLWLSIPAFAFSLAIEFSSFSHMRGYQDDARKTLELNARALRIREIWGFPRLVVLCSAVFWVGRDIAGAAFITLIVDICIPTYWYALTCFYLGPGEHGRKRRSAWNRSAAAQGAIK